MDLVVSFNKANLLKSVRGGLTVELGAVLAKIPFVEVKAIYGNGRYADVRVNKGDLAALEAAVGEYCVVSPQQDAQPFDR